jgi:hypothetical protein
MELLEPVLRALPLLAREIVVGDGLKQRTQMDPLAEQGSRSGVRDDPDIVWINKCLDVSSDISSGNTKQ